jgi:DNA-binding NarL/FixJ family response regulator
VEQIKVLFLEDDGLTRSSVADALRSSGCEVFTAETAMEALEHQDVDCALLDLHLGNGPTGIDVARKLRAQNPNIGLVFLTSFEDPRLLDKDLKFLPRASSYLVKRQIFDTQQLLLALRASIRNVTSELKDIELPAEFAHLTNVQLETLRLIGQGLSNSEIAKTRSVSVKSVEQTISLISKKFSLPQGNSSNNRVNLARVYYRLLGVRD